MAVAKGIGSGFPMGACLTTNEIAQFMKAGTHGSTFGGNPLAISVAKTVLNLLLDNNFLKKIDDISRYLWQELINVQKQSDEILDVRGAGLLLGIKTKSPNEKINKLFMENHLLAVCASDNIIRFTPPLIIEKYHVDEAIAKIKKSLIK